MVAAAEEFGERLRELRAKAELSQSGLAEHAGVPVGTIQALEQGRYTPSWVTVCALAEAFDCADWPLMRKARRK